MRLKHLLFSIGLAVLAQDARAQRSAAVSITPGTRVRVKTPSLVAPLVANFLEQRGDTLVFIEDGRGRGVWSFGIDQIQRLETTAGQAGLNKRPIARGAAIGGGVGLVTGLIFAAAAQPSDSTKEYSRLLTGAAGLGVGAGVGALVGSMVKSERWVTVPLPGRLSAWTNGRGRFAFSFGLR